MLPHEAETDHQKVTLLAKMCDNTWRTLDIDPATMTEEELQETIQALKGVEESTRKLRQSLQRQHQLLFYRKLNEAIQ